MPENPEATGKSSPRWERWFWITLLTLAFYVLSYPGAIWLAVRLPLPARARPPADRILLVYKPLVILCEKIPICGKAMRWYCQFWPMPD